VARKGFSPEARKASALARKIRNRLGEDAYQLFKKTGQVPTGLDDAKPPSRRTKSDSAATDAAKQARQVVKNNAPPKKDTDPEKLAKLARAFPSLSNPDLLSAWSRKPRKPSRSELHALASEQARQALTDAALVAHFTDTGVYKSRGEKPELVATHRDHFHQGKPIPMWAVPKDIDVALYRDDSSDIPMVVGRIVGVTSRKAPSGTEKGESGLSRPIQYTRFRDQDGKIYEYPSLLGGGRKSPHATHASFAATDPILRGQSFIPSIGFQFPNFYTGEDAGESGAPEGVDTLARNIQRALSFAEATERRRAQKEQP
jgi:hypothetical protein